MRRESLCKLFKHAGVFDFRSEGQGNTFVSECVYDERWGKEDMMEVGQWDRGKGADAAEKGCIPLLIRSQG